MAELAFACDAMLGSLARWLRFAGFDTFFDAGLPDTALAARARHEGRWLITADRRLAATAGPRSLLLTAKGLAAQVAEVRRRTPMTVDPARFFTRCSRCNGAMREASRGEVIDLVPPYVAATADRFRRCEGCARVYWPGTHTVRIAETLASLFGVEVQITER